jgi:hypothetical protein
LMLFIGMADSCYRNVRFVLSESVFLSGICDALTENITSDNRSNPLRNLRGQSSLITKRDKGSADNGSPQLTRFEFFHVFIG